MRQSVRILIEQVRLLLHLDEVIGDVLDEGASGQDSRGKFETGFPPDWGAS
jgi:hypothetical protein